MNLTQAMKRLMAYCYSNGAATHYEYVLDKRDNYQAVRLFLTEFNYLLLEVTDAQDIIRVSHFETIKSNYYPSSRVGFLNSLFKKYRSGTFNGHSVALIPIDKLIPILEKLDSTSIRLAMADVHNDDRHYKNCYRDMFRASGGF